MQEIGPIRKSKVFSSFKYDEQMLEDGTYVLEENKEYKEFFRGTVAHCIYRNISCTIGLLIIIFTIFPLYLSKSFPLSL